MGKNSDNLDQKFFNFNSSPNLTETKNSELLYKISALVSNWRPEYSSDNTKILNYGYIDFKRV